MTPIDTGAVDTLQRYGPWALVVLLLGVVAYLYRAITAERATFEEKLMSVMDRLIETTTTQLKEYAALAQSVANTVESLSRRIDDRTRNGNGGGK